MKRIRWKTRGKKKNARKHTNCDAEDASGNIKACKNWVSKKMKDAALRI